MGGKSGRTRGMYPILGLDHLTCSFQGNRHVTYMLAQA